LPFTVVKTPWPRAAFGPAFLASLARILAMAAIAFLAIRSVAAHAIFLDAADRSPVRLGLVDESGAGGARRWR